MKTSMGLDCKTVRIFAYNFKYARAVKQNIWKVWNTPRFSDFFTDFEKKTDCFAVYDGITKI